MPDGFECLLCETHQADPFLLDCKDYYLGKDYPANFYRCADCGLVQQSPVPLNVARFYENYPVHRPKASLFELTRRKIMKPCYFDVRDIPDRKGAPPTIVDFGCGDGWFLDSLGEERLERVGYELDKDQAQRLSESIGIPVFSSEPDLLEAYRGKVDVVTMHFVLEHLTDPHRIFRLLRDLLKPSGVLFFTVPNISSWEFKLFGRKWHNLDPPRHICFPEQRSVQRIASKWGFEITDVRPIPFPNGFAGSIPVLLFGRFRFAAYLLALPLGVLTARMFPGGNQAYTLIRQ